VRSFNRCYIGEAISNTYCWNVFVALGIQHAMHMHGIVICGLPGSTLFFHINFITGMIFEKKVIEHKMCVSIFSAVFA
jgi:hypothetical protein